MDDVARAAGVSHGLVYHYFPSKRRLFLAVLRSVADQLLAATVADTSKSPIERLYAGMRSYLVFAEEYPSGYTALMSGGNGVDEEVRALCEEARWKGLEEIMRSSGIENPPPAIRIALRGWSGFQEGAVIEWLKRRDMEREELLDLLARTLGSALRLAGISAEENT